MMIDTNYKLKLKDVKSSDYEFLYELLSNREPNVNISHRKMPNYKQHVKFVTSKPYFKWYVIYRGNNKIGSVYISKQDEIGIHLIKSSDILQLSRSIMDLIITKNPRKRYLVNVNPKNKKMIQFLQKNGFNLIQYTYELIDSKMDRSL
jgi:hypothetical protein